MDDEIKIGDRVRSYDFPGMRTDCYVEGIVRDIASQFNVRGDRYGENERITFGCQRYQIEVTRVVHKNEDMAWAGKYRFPPVNGTATLLGRECNGVEKIDGQA